MNSDRNRVWHRGRVALFREAFHHREEHGHDKHSQKGVARIRLRRVFTLNREIPILNCYKFD